jgi:hypothetical protein
MKKLKKSRVVYILLAFVCAVNVSCRQPVDNLAAPDKDGAYTSSDSYADIFDTFWQGMNNNYAYWSIEPTDYWDKVYDEFKPRFRALGDYSSGTDEQSDRNRKLAYTYFLEFLSPLRDGHLSVNFYPPLEKLSISPNKTRVLSRPGAKDVIAAFTGNWSGAGDPDHNNNYNFWKNTINKTKYIAAGTGCDSYENPPNGVSGTQSTAPDISLRVATGHIDLSGGSGDYILYLYFNEFALLGNSDNPAVAHVLDRFYGDLTGDPRVKGLVIDLRGNGGGDSSDVELLIGSLIDTPLLIGHTRVKNGPGRLDYQPWTPWVIAPQEKRNPNVKVAVIASDRSISCAEVTTMAVKALPDNRGYVVGTMTWGAVGGRLNNTNPTFTNGGPFTGNKFWKQVIQAGAETKSFDGENYEAVGIAPDQWVDFDMDSFLGSSLKDSQLEAAIKHLDSGRTF